MPSSRRARRRQDRARRKRPTQRRQLSVGTRIGMVAGGVVLVVAGVALLSAGQPATAHRLARLAGLLIVVGVALAGIAVYESVKSV